MYRQKDAQADRHASHVCQDALCWCGWQLGCLLELPALRPHCIYAASTGSNTSSHLSTSTASLPVFCVTHRQPDVPPPAPLSSNRRWWRWACLWAPPASHWTAWSAWGCPSSTMACASRGRCVCVCVGCGCVGCGYVLGVWCVLMDGVGVRGKHIDIGSFGSPSGPSFFQERGKHSHGGPFGCCVSCQRSSRAPHTSALDSWHD
jgi:hypothetical protein